ncbi:MAG: methyltransferase domain-containing protein [Candidatus Eremiobacteraeota bacterium]|nr:methyltransferase domain-containing protein [Candidatus Eremiobacteraeota bacterium]
MFGQAEDYERFMGRWSRRLARQFVDFAQLGSVRRVIDVGCGTGALAAAIAEIAPAAEIVGIDPSAPYVERARSQVRGQFTIGNAQELAFEDASFDAACACLVLNFIPNQKAALAEMRRVVRPGGTLAAVVWDHAEGMTMLKTFWDVVDELDRDPKPVEEPNPLLGPRDLQRLWHDMGLVDIRFEPLVIDMPFASFDDYWQPFSHGQGPAGMYVAQASPAMRVDIARELRRRFSISNPLAPFTLTARAWAIRGTKKAAGESQTPTRT